VKSVKTIDEKQMASTVVDQLGSCRAAADTH